MSESHQVSPLQFDVLRVIWAQGEASVAQVHERLEDRHLALTTVATILTRMAKKKLVSHRKQGRQYIYRPAVTEGQVRASMVGELTDMLFGGNPAELVSHLIAAEDIESGDLDRVKALIKAKEQENEKGERDV